MHYTLLITDSQVTTGKFYTFSQGINKAFYTFSQTYRLAAPIGRRRHGVLRLGLARSAREARSPRGAPEDALAETRQGPGVRELCDRGRTQTCLHAVREMVPQDHQPGTRANRERAAGVPPGIQGTVRSRPLLKSVECELRSAKLLKFCGAVARATPLGVPLTEEKRPFHLWKRTSPFIHRGEMRFDGLKMGKLQSHKIHPYPTFSFAAISNYFRKNGVAHLRATFSEKIDI